MGPTDEADNRDARLTLAGRSPERAHLEGLAGDLGLRDRVRLLGVISAAIALILPSSREGLVRSIMETLSLEVPVIVSTARGNGELVGADSGPLFAAGDVQRAGQRDGLADRSPGPREDDGPAWS